MKRKEIRIRINMNMNITTNQEVSTSLQKNLKKQSPPCHYQIKDKRRKEWIQKSLQKYKNEKHK